MQILECVIHLCQNILPLISIIHTQPCPIPVNYHYHYPVIINISSN